MARVQSDEMDFFVFVVLQSGVKPHANDSNMFGSQIHVRARIMLSLLTKDITIHGMTTRVRADPALHTTMKTHGLDTQTQTQMQTCRVEPNTQAQHTQLICRREFVETAALVRLTTLGQN